MLGRFDDDELAKRLKAMRREALTPQTVTDPKQLLKTIQTDRSKGFSLVDRFLPLLREGAEGVKDRLL
jgi:IclR family pca regulon transcriptional regulator